MHLHCSRTLGNDKAFAPKRLQAKFGRKGERIRESEREEGKRVAKQLSWIMTGFFNLGGSFAFWKTSWLVPIKCSPAASESILNDIFHYFSVLRCLFFLAKRLDKPRESHCQICLTDVRVCACVCVYIHIFLTAAKCGTYYPMLGSQ